MNNIFNDTLEIYRSLLAYLINTTNTEWEDIKEIPSSEYRVNYIEKLIHRTIKNPNPKYTDLDTIFFKLPSYLRRAAISSAVGIVSSFNSNHKNWETKGKKGQPPRLQLKHYNFPAMYKGNTFVKTGLYTAKIKIFHKNDWVWLDVQLRKSDMDYILRHKMNSKEMSATLEKKGKAWCLRFAFKDNKKLTNRKKVILGVDLGEKNSATCSVMRSDGTIVARRMFRFPIEQDRMERMLNVIKKAQQNGARQTPKLWAFANNYNKSVTEKTANAIVGFAKEYHCNVIVFEYLDMKGKIGGSKRQKLHLWRKKGVFGIVTTKAHLFGMRVARVCAWNTSKLAFDGSGEVKRGKYTSKKGIERNNYSMCLFQSGKEYHCDLNASYNIGARYYIREFLKTLPATARLAVEAKVPRLAKRTTCVLSDLLSLYAALAA